jgi:maltoporin
MGKTSRSGDSRGRHALLCAVVLVTAPAVAAAQEADAAPPAAPTGALAAGGGAAAQPASEAETRAVSPNTPLEPTVADAEARRRAIEFELERPKLLEFHGYLRSGFGINGKGGDQDAFHAPGAATKYRLGNETETYGEAMLVSNWLDPRATGGITFRTEVLLAFVTGENANFDSHDVFTMREAFAEAGGVVRALPDLKFWAGERYYFRQDIHILDFYFMDMSGYGGGLTDLNARIGRLSLAYLGGSTDDKTDVTSRGRGAKSTFDLRLSDVHLGQTSLLVWLAGSYVSGGSIPGAAGLPSIHGFAAGLFHTIPLLGGSNRLAVQFGSGALTDMNTYYHTPAKTLPDGTRPGSLAVEDSWRLRVTDTLLVQPDRWFSMMAVGLYEVTDFGATHTLRQSWYSVGARPILHFTEYLSLAVEAGLDYVASDVGPSDYLTKFSIAPQASSGRTFFSRPAVRVYFTFAKWGDQFKGLVGGPAYLTDTAGVSTGVQIESWW